MDGLTRQMLHNKVDEVFDELEKYSKRRDSAHWLHRLMLMWEPMDDSITGTVLVKSYNSLAGRPYITWGISPFGAGLHSGHYDLGPIDASRDWINRVERGW